MNLSTAACSLLYPLAAAWALVFPAALEAAPPANATCPVMPAETVDPAVFTAYQGQKVFFCCTTCRDKFLANPQRYLGRLPQFGPRSGSGEPADPAPPPAGPVEAGPGHSAGDVPLLGRLHPLIVHFPLAGLPLALCALAVGRLSGRASFAAADVVPLLAGSAAAVVAVISGNVAHDHMTFASGLHGVVEWHERLSTSVMILAVLACLLRWWAPRRTSSAWWWGYAGLLACCCVLLAVTGYLGGTLVFGADHLRW